MIYKLDDAKPSQEILYKPGLLTHSTAYCLECVQWTLTVTTPDSNISRENLFRAYFLDDSSFPTKLAFKQATWASHSSLASNGGQFLVTVTPRTVLGASITFNGKTSE